MAEKSAEYYRQEGSNFLTGMRIVPQREIFEQLTEYGERSDFKLEYKSGDDVLPSDVSYATQGILYCMTTFFKEKGWTNRDDAFFAAMPFSACFLGVGLVILNSFAKSQNTMGELPFTTGGKFDFKKAVHCMVDVETVYDIDHTVFDMLRMDRQSQEAKVIHIHISRMADFCYAIAGVRYQWNGPDAAFEQITECMEAMLSYGVLVGQTILHRQMEAKQNNILTHDGFRTILLKHQTGVVEHMHTDETKITYIVKFTDAGKAEAFYQDIEKYGNVGAYMQPRKQFLKTVYIVTCEFYPC